VIENKEQESVPIWNVTCISKACTRVQISVCPDHSADWRNEKNQRRIMRKFISIAGMILFVALLLVQPAKADNFDTFTLTSGSTNISFTLPATLTPSSVGRNGLINIANVSGTYDGGSYTFNTVQPPITRPRGA
jgi:hypothetical protein